MSPEFASGKLVAAQTLLRVVVPSATLDPAYMVFEIDMIEQRAVLF